MLESNMDQGSFNKDNVMSTVNERLAVVESKTDSILELIKEESNALKRKDDNTSKKFDECFRLINQNTLNHAKFSTKVYTIGAVFFFLGPLFGGFLSEVAQQMFFAKHDTKVIQLEKVDEQDLSFYKKKR